MADNLDRHHRPPPHLSHFLRLASTDVSSFLTPQASHSSISHLTLLSLTSSSDSPRPDSRTPSSSEKVRRIPFAVRLPTGKGGGPAFVGPVFSMCDRSSTGLMAVSTHFDIPFLSERIPEWLKKMFPAVTKSEGNCPVFRFFMDSGDAVSYVKMLKIPGGVVGECRLDIAYEHLKERPDLFQFVPNERQVKDANKLLKTLPHIDGTNKVEGVPVFSARNMDIAITTMDGIKWYTPYYFDKSTLDHILEESADVHFRRLIFKRNFLRRRDVFGDNMTAEVVEEMGESMDPREVQEVLDEMGHPSTPLSVISKAAEIQLLHAVDKIVLGNRWLRKAIGIQPKFPYMIDSFERKTEDSILRAHLISNFKLGEDESPSISEMESKDNAREKQRRSLNQQSLLNSRQHRGQEVQSSRFLPKITLFGVSAGDTGKMSIAEMNKTVDDLILEMKALQYSERASLANWKRSESMVDERDPLFVANVSDSHPGMGKSGEAIWVRGL